MDHTRTRRTFLGQAAAVGAAAVAASLTPTAAPALAASRGALTTTQTATLVAWCDTLVPGARAADVGSFVLAQLAKPADDALLMLRYLDWPPPYDAFYRSGLDALDATARRRFGLPVAALGDPRRQRLLNGLLAGEGRWEGPPFFLFYLATRADGVDVVYGTPRGIRSVGVPYRPLVAPRERW